MRMVKQTVNEDDRGARHLFFGDERGQPGHADHLPRVPAAGAGHRSAWARPTTSPSRSRTTRSSQAWRDYLTAQGVACTEVMDRTFFKSIYLRDPDGHIVELATVGPGITPDA